MATTYSVPRAPSASKSGIPIYADTTQLRRLARDLATAAPEAWAACRVGLRAAGNVVADDARGRASFSPATAASIRVRTLRGNVKVVAGGGDVTQAAPLENLGKGHPRHPLFGNRNYWYTNNTPAYLAPAFDAHREQVLGMIEEAVYGAVERAISGRI